MSRPRSSDAARPIPLVVAHRGASADWPEHTPAAVLGAVEAGADAVECDVRLTADGVPVCVHDPTVDRTSDGTGRVGRLTLDQLRALDWGSWHPGAWRDRPPGDPRSLLTLAELADLLVRAPRPVGLFVETKHPVCRGDRVEVAVADAISVAARRLPVVTGMSFWPPAVWRFRRLVESSGLRLQPVRLRSATWPLPDPGAPQAVGLEMRLVRRRPGVVAGARRTGADVYVWTVNEPSDVELCRALGVDAIITDRPAEVRDMLHG